MSAPPPGRRGRALIWAPPALRPRAQTREALGGQRRPRLQRTASRAVVARLHRGRRWKPWRGTCGSGRLWPRRARSRPSRAAAEWPLTRYTSHAAPVGDCTSNRGPSSRLPHSCEEAPPTRVKVAGTGEEKARSVEFARKYCRRDGRTQRRQIARERRT